MDWTQIIVTALLVLFGSGGVVVTLIQNGKKHEIHHEKTDMELQTVIDSLKELQSQQIDVKNELKNNSQSTKKQIKYSLTRLHKECMERNSVSMYELECAEDLYTEYKHLGGNSFIDTLMTDLRDLKIRGDN